MKRQKTVVLRDNLEVIPNIYDLKPLGAGHDGRVFRLGDRALKLLKYDLDHRKEKGLMTFEKAFYIKSELDLKRIIKPIDIMLDMDGSYAGYVMWYIENLISDKSEMPPILISDYTCGSLLQTTYDLVDDFDELTRKNITAKDINRGSFIFSHDFLHICDMDKFQDGLNHNFVNNKNREMLNFTIAKCLYFAMLENKTFDKQELKLLSTWIKRCSNSLTFIRDLEKEICYEDDQPIGEFVKSLSSKIL